MSTLRFKDVNHVFEATTSATTSAAQKKRQVSIARNAYYSTKEALRDSFSFEQDDQDNQAAQSAVVSVCIVGDQMPAKRVYKQLLGKIENTFSGCVVVIGGPEQIACTVYIAQLNLYVYVTHSCVGIETADAVILTSIGRLAYTSVHAYLTGVLLAFLEEQTRFICATYNDGAQSSFSQSWGELVNKTDIGRYMEHEPIDVVENRLIQWLTGAAHSSSTPNTSKKFYIDSLISTKGIAPNIGNTVASIGSAEFSCAQTFMSALLFQHTCSTVGKILKAKEPLAVALTIYAPSLMYLLSKFQHKRQQGTRAEPYYAFIPAVFDMSDKKTLFALYSLCNILSLLCGYEPAYEIDFVNEAVRTKISGRGVPKLMFGFRIPTPIELLWAATYTPEAGCLLGNVEMTTQQQYIRTYTKSGYAYDYNNNLLPTGGAIDAPQTWPIVDDSKPPLTTLLANHSLPTGAAQYDILSVVPNIVSLAESAEVFDLTKPLISHINDINQNKKAFPVGLRLSELQCGGYTITPNNIESVLVNTKRSFLSYAPTDGLLNKGAIAWAGLRLVRGNLYPKL